MSIATAVTRGYGSFGSIAEVVTRGYLPSAAVTYPEGTLVSRGYGNPTTIADIVRRNYGTGAAAAPDPGDTGIGAGETVLVPGPRARYYTREELEALLQTLIKETESITRRKVDKRKRPEAVIKAVKRSLGKERVQVSKLRELAVVWNEGAAMVRRHADAERRENELHIAVVLEAYFRRMAWLRDEDDIATLLALGEL